MYARSTTVRGNPQAVDDGIAYVHDKVMPAVLQMDGCIGISMLCDRDSGRCIVTTSWDDHEALRRSEEGVRGIRDHFAGLLGGPPEVEEWEIVVLHRRSEAPDGACAGVLWTRSDPTDMDRMIDAFRTSLLPRLDELPGFCSLSVLIDRRTGLTATTTIYESRDARDRARVPSLSMREEFVGPMGMAVTDTGEFDLVLAHLRVPETV